MGDGMKRAKAHASGPTVMQLAALKKADLNPTGRWWPIGAGQFQMARRMNGVWGRMWEGEGYFEINDIGHRLARET